MLGEMDLYSQGDCSRENIVCMILLSLVVEEFSLHEMIQLKKDVIAKAIETGESIDTILQVQRQFHTTIHTMREREAFVLRKMEYMMELLNVEFRSPEEGYEE